MAAQVGLGREDVPSLSLPGTRQLTAWPRAMRDDHDDRTGGRDVSRAHDIGGQTGFGPVPVGEDGLPFHHDWEARVYALNGALRARGLYIVDEFRDAIERIPPQEYLELSYYERWLRAIETLLSEKALLPGALHPDDGLPAAQDEG